MTSAGWEALFSLSCWDCPFEQSYRCFLPDASISEGHGKATGFHRAHSVESDIAREAAW